MFDVQQVAGRMFVGTMAEQVQHAILSAALVRCAYGGPANPWLGRYGAVRSSAPPQALLASLGRRAPGEHEDGTSDPASPTRPIRKRATHLAALPAEFELPQPPAKLNRPEQHSLGKSSDMK